MAGAGVVGAAVIGAAIVGAAVVATATSVGELVFSVVVGWHASNAANASKPTAVVLMIVLIGGGRLPASTEPCEQLPCYGALDW